MNFNLYTLLSLFLALSGSICAQQNYWTKEFISKHTVKSIKKFKNPSSQSAGEMILELNYNLDGKELSRWQLSDTLIYLTLNYYNEAGLLERSNRLMKSANQKDRVFDTILFSEFTYPNDSMQKRISWTSKQLKSTASQHLTSLKSIEQYVNQPNFGKATFNDEGLLIEDHWGFTQQETHGCIITTSGDLYYRKINYDKYKRKVNESWFKNDCFYKSISYYYDDKGLPKFELISFLNNNRDSISVEEYHYSIQ